MSSHLDRLEMEVILEASRPGLDRVQQLRARVRRDMIVPMARELRDSINDPNKLQWASAIAQGASEILGIVGAGFEDDAFDEMIENIRLQRRAMYLSVSGSKDVAAAAKLVADTEAYVARVKQKGLIT